MEKRGYHQRWCHNKTEAKGFILFKLTTRLKHFKYLGVTMNVIRLLVLEKNDLAEFFVSTKPP